MDISLILQIYFIVSGAVAVGLLFFLDQKDFPDTIDNFWDWVAYSLLWWVYFIKAIIKQFINAIKWWK